MTKLSGLVAILDDKGEVIGTKDLGPVPVEVKSGLVKPLEIEQPVLGGDEQLTSPVYERRGEKVVAAYGKEKIPPPLSAKERFLAAVALTEQELRTVLSEFAGAKG